MIEVPVPRYEHSYPKKLSEHDLETWMYDHPEILFHFLGEFKWIAKQFEIPSGKIDLLGMSEKLNSLILVELKISEFKEAYLTQISRYSKDLDDIQELFPTKYAIPVISILIATGEPSKIVQYSANALKINLMTITIDQNKIDIPDYRWDWTPEVKELINSKLQEISKNPIFIPLIIQNQTSEEQKCLSE